MSGTAISDFGASLFIINPFAIGLGRVSAAALLCQADQSRSRLIERKSRPRHLDGGAEGHRGEAGDIWST